MLVVDAAVAAVVAADVVVDVVDVGVIVITGTDTADAGSGC